MLVDILIAAMIAASAPIFGIAQAGDGDSITIGSERLRLFGIDAPEFDQSCTGPGGKYACGKRSADYLASLVTGREVRCDKVGTDQYDRTLARCYVSGREINEVMVANGHATAYRRYSLQYVAAETSARAKKIGLWSGTFQNPSEYRGEHRGTAKPSTAMRGNAIAKQRAPTIRGGCVIKGNHSRRGEWIYHVPGMPYYDQTRPEAMFCSEAEAVAAGYRRARVR